MDKIISIDETSLTPFMFRPYSRCPLGEKCIETTDNNKVFTKHTFVGAISSSRMMGWKVYEEGAMNADRFVEFIANSLGDVITVVFVCASMAHSKYHSRELMYSRDILEIISC